MRLIDKDSLVADIEKLKEESKLNSKSISEYIKGGIYGFDLAIEKTLGIIDTLEVKEVDLEKEIDNYIYTNNGRQRLALELDWKQCNITFNGGKLIDFAKHFFELGLQAQKGE